ncbi:MAG: hypothetical protein ACXVIM_05200 [Acidimicrobiia bacterium]
MTATATPAFAGTVTQPTSTPVVVTANGAGNPYSFSVQGSGFEPGQNVYIEQCDGNPTTSIFWDPTINCDLGSSPAPAPADASGKVTFSTSDGNHAFHPFRGQSPQGLFDCLAPADPPTGSGNPSWTNCQVRLSTNNAAVTSDQVFFTIRFLPNSSSKLSCATKGSLTFNKPLTNVIPTKSNGDPKPAKATKIKGVGTLGTAAGPACDNSNEPALATKYPVTSGSVKYKGSFPAGSLCSVLSNPTLGGTTASIKWQGINPKNSKLSTAGKSTVVLSNGSLAVLPTGGYVIDGTVTAGSFLGSTVRFKLALDGGVLGESNTCAAGSLAGASFNGTMSPSSIAVL